MLLLLLGVEPAAKGQGEGLPVLWVVGDGLAAQQGGKFERGAAAFRHVPQGHGDGARAGKGISTILSFVNDYTVMIKIIYYPLNKTILVCVAYVEFD